MKKMVFLLGTGLLALTACGGPAKAMSEATSAPVTVQTNTVGTPSPVNTPKPSESPTEAPKPKKPSFSVAVAKKLNTKQVSFDVQEYRPNLVTNKNGTRTDGVKVKACIKAVTEGRAMLTWASWGAKDNAGNDIPAQSFNYPIKPTFPDGQVINNGHCVTGWFFFDVKGKNTVTSIVYDNQFGTSAVWSIKQK